MSTTEIFASKDKNIKTLGVARHSQQKQFSIGSHVSLLVNHNKGIKDLNFNLTELLRKNSG